MTTQPEAMPVRPCALDDPHDGHVRLNDKWCPGIEDDDWSGVQPARKRPWTADQSLDYLIVASCGRGVPTAVTASECGQAVRTELARLRAIESAAVATVDGATAGMALLYRAVKDSPR